MRYLKYIFFSLFLFASINSYSIERKKILVLHSYHQGLKWTDNVNFGIREVMDSLGNKFELDYEYLDTKRNPSKEYLDKIIELYDLKLQGEKYDAIIVSDNNALSFVKNHGKKYFNNTPIVFCGINHYRDDLIEGITNITGVAEEVDWDGAIDLILRTRPNTKHLVVINDDKTTTARLNKLTLLDLERKYEPKLQFTYFEDQTVDELKENVRNIKGDTCILLLTFNKDKNGRFISFQDNLDLFVPQSKVPVFITWAFLINDGVVGGKVVSGRLHGKMAATMIDKVISGTPADSIPVYRKPLDKYVVNYNEIKRFGISEKLLPDKTLLVNAPQSFYSENKEWIDLIGGITFLATLIILVLSRAIVRRIRAEKALIIEQNRLKISVKHERLIGLIGRLLNASEDFKSVLDDVLKLMTDELNVARISLYSLMNSTNTGVKIKSRISLKGKNIKDVNQFYFSEIDEIISRVKMNKSIVSRDLSNLTEKEQDYYKRRNIGAVVLLPVMVENEVVGLMGFAQNKAHGWTRDEISIFFSTVNMIANAWERNSLMTDRIEAEQKNVEALRMLEQSSRLASIGVMAAGITHEINQPLNAIKITADSVLFWQKRNPGQLPEMFTRKIQTIFEGTSRIDSIIKHMRTFWEKPHISEEEIVDMVEGVNRSLSLVKRQVSDHSIELIDNLPKNVVNVYANYIQFEQIVVNLIVNSIHSLDKVQKENKKIELIVYQDSKHGVLEIHDNGTGIESSIREKIYDPLFTTKGNESGSGLGMAIVKTFIDRFQGEISDYNNEDGGASFILRFKLKSTEEN
ncbi:ABC transporter substrate binding protein [Labilibaculum sp. K2S]|uniref:ABC transporter substrate binding protein n=1 Tax=Labilibaculum sp. K2S TaxID=3056386 RepID=UPI0025A47D21|nr:ABC transporter substrate binding protein [Labilibaculum sp. K2S]MDM8161726.1 ABC transporter substrate binding protein [Labilibaculum sp. K2S]